MPITDGRYMNVLQFTDFFFYLKNIPKFKKKELGGNSKKSFLKGFDFVLLLEKAEYKNQTKIIKDLCWSQKQKVLRLGDKCHGYSF